MIELDDLTFVQLATICVVMVFGIFFFCNWLNTVWVFQPM
jgi:hypothetical protein